VVVWNATRRCNLRCVHCYSASTLQPAREELTGEQAHAMIRDLADFAVPVILFSGGEPLMREDLLELIAHASGAGIRAVLSTNGTLVTAELARKLAAAGLDYAGISLDGLEKANDRFRGTPGAFASAMAGLQCCRRAGIRVGLRFTMTLRNLDQLAGIFDLVLRENIPRVCFYHLVSSGRGKALAEDVLDAGRTRAAIDQIIDLTAAAHAAGAKAEVLTVDNHADGPYLYMRLLKTDPARAAECLELLRRQGGNSSGRRIGCISWNGDVHPDQFWRRHVLGNVGRRRFSEIWSDDSQPLLAGLRDRRKYLKGRCAGCRWIEICNGNLRARAETATGDMWGEDPACYLTEEEI
jgi:radical SAM protein with 4Fe4S-binding SPASM domain